MKLRYVYRSSETGRYVSRAYAEANPATTVRERIAVRDSGDVR